MTTPRVGVLALQGDVREHARVLAALGAEVTLVRRPGDLASIDGLVLPGGESSVIDKLSRAFGMRAPIRDAIAGGLPVYGTCAGLILLADRLENDVEGVLLLGGLGGCRCGPFLRVCHKRTSERDAGRNRHAGKKPKEKGMPHQNAFRRK